MDRITRSKTVQKAWFKSLLCWFLDYWIPQSYYQFWADNLLIKADQIFLSLTNGCVCCVLVSDPMWPQDCSPPASSVHGIIQARILEWVANSSFRGSFWPRDKNCISYILALESRFFTTSATWESLLGEEYLECHYNWLDLNFYIFFTFSALKNCSWVTIYKINEFGTYHRTSWVAGNG